MKRVFCFSLLLIFSLRATAEVATWDAVVRSAWRNHPELRAFRDDITASDLQVEVSQSGFYPRVSLFMAREESQSKSSLLSTRTDLTTETYGLKADWNIFSGFSTLSLSRKSTIELEKIKADYKLKSAQIRADLRKLFDQAQISSETIQIYERLQKRYEEQVKVMSAKFQGGTEAKWAVELAQANLELVKATLLSEKNNLKSALRELRQATGQEWTSFARTEWKLPDDVQFSIEDSPQFMSSRWFVEARKQDVELSQSTFWPSVDLSYQKGKLEFSDQSNKDESKYTISMTYLLFEGKSGLRKYQAAKALASSAETKLIKLKQDLIDSERRLREQLVTDDLFLKARELEVKGVRSYAEATNAQYRLGVRKFSEWDNVQSRLLQAERALIAAKKQWLVSRADWEQTRGLELESQK